MSSPFSRSKPPPHDAPTGVPHGPHGRLSPDTTPATFADGATLRGGSLAFASTALDLSPVAPVRAGDLVSNKYRVERLLGQGGMGLVVLATHVHLGQKVAIKVMKPEACRVPGAAARFLREAQASVHIQSEHVARVMDVGTHDLGPPRGPMPYMVMEYLSGTDLAELLRARGPLPIDDALDYLLQACEAIAEAHRLGIVHRDLKPANLFLTARADASPLLKVLDFGISKSGALGDGLAQASLTTDQSVLGSPRYMSPEQMRSTKSVDARTDVWALGCILYELLVGQPAFDAETPAGLAAVVATADAPLLHRLRADAPPALDSIVHACLEKDPSRRMQSVGELARALAPVAPARAQVSIERVVRIARGSTPPSSVVPAPRIHAAPAGWAPTASALPAAGAVSGGTGQNFARSNATQGRGAPGRVAIALASAIGLVGTFAAFVFWRDPTRLATPNSPASSVSVVAGAVSSATPVPAQTPRAAFPTIAPAPSTPASPEAPSPQPVAVPLPTQRRAPRPKVAPRAEAAPSPASTSNAGGTSVDPNDHGLQDRK